MLLRRKHGEDLSGGGRLSVEKKGSILLMFVLIL
jgi:hypothetical protein